MIAAHFTHIDTWVFDLDNTLYHPSAGLFALMDTRLRDYVGRITGLDGAAAVTLAHAYWQEHGSTLAGLMMHHDVDPMEFLTEMHDIDITHLQPDPTLAAAIAALPGRRIVYTNGSHNHAKRVLAARGLTRAFDAVYGVEHADFKPKPQPAAFDAVFARDGITPQRAAMFEDEARNLAIPHTRGMRTVHVHDIAAPAPHIHHHTDDLTGFLSQLVSPDFSSAPKRPMSAS